MCYIFYLNGIFYEFCVWNCSFSFTLPIEWLKKVSTVQGKDILSHFQNGGKTHEWDTLELHGWDTHIWTLDAAKTSTNDSKNVSIYFRDLCLSTNVYYSAG